MDRVSFIARDSFPLLYLLSSTTHSLSLSCSGTSSPLPPAHSSPLPYLSWVLPAASRSSHCTKGDFGAWICSLPQIKVQVACKAMVPVYCCPNIALTSLAESSREKLMSADTQCKGKLQDMICTTRSKTSLQMTHLSYPRRSLPTTPVRGRNN
ncbi:hypothetical protein PAHAL_3G300600 [Panicum hallii]|uniref:Uncharacterized protein n=1 Tax=Panicum hallii TaxID=206008 RepID=A0A2S3HCH6_9POAL|nr:hypothetical protein PAHAL_3G300600 [Panicum hallii]